MTPSLRPSLGSLAAMAALALPAAANAQVMVSATNHVTVSRDNTFDIDIDGDGVADFYVNNVFVTPALVPLDTGDLIFSNGGSSISVQNFNFGDTITAGADSNAGLDFNTITGGTGYVGINFIRGGTTHTGWLLFDLTAVNGDIVITSAGWEATAGVSITAGATPAVPEPANVASGIGLLAGLAAWLRRRRSAA